VTEHVAEVTGLAAFGSVGAAVTVSDRAGGPVPGEIVGFRGDEALVMGFRDIEAAASCAAAQHLRRLAKG
jgi:hypothetical protein